jgi:hypothetical protein
MNGIFETGGDDGIKERFRVGVRENGLGVVKFFVGVSTMWLSVVLCQAMRAFDSRTRPYVVFAAKHIRQIPRSMLNHDSVAGLFVAVQVDCLDLVGE